MLWSMAKHSIAILMHNLIMPMHAKCMCRNYSMLRGRLKLVAYAALSVYLDD